MKYTIDVHEFSFNKIKNGTRKIGIHLFDKYAQNIKLHDILNMKNSSTGECLECTVKGIAIFDNFNDMIDALGPAPLGYDNKQEIMIRLDRIFPKKLRQNINTVAFFLEPKHEKVNLIERGEIER